MKQIALIDDEPQLLQHFSRSLFGHTVHTFASIQIFLETHRANNFEIDILFLDLNLRAESGLEALPMLQNYCSTIIIYTVNENPTELLEAFRLGAVGYIDKSVSVQDLGAFVSVIEKGGSAISTKMAQMLIGQFAPPTQNNTQRLAINEKEYEVLGLLSEGWSYKLIADRTGLSIDGVRFYIKRIYKALSVHSKGEAIHKFYQDKLL